MRIPNNTFTFLNHHRKYIIELGIIFVLACVVYYYAASADIFEWMIDFTRSHESWELDEIIPVAIFLMVAAFVFSLHRWLEIVASKKELELAHEQLKQAMSEIKVLKGVLPICASCKKIRDDEGYWHQLERYMSEHIDVDFTHGICNECKTRLYPDIKFSN